MHIVQLTGLVIPILLGIARYYLSNQDTDRSLATDEGVIGAIFVLFSPLALV